MRRPELTDRASLVTTLLMQKTCKRDRNRSQSAVHTVMMLVAGAMAVAGCVSVNAPDKPIVIELNINIKQEVIYRLAQDADNTIDKNPGIF